MYEILRVPPGPGHMRKAYDLIQAYFGSANRLEFKDFISSVKSVYMIADKEQYYGMGWVCLSKHSDMTTMVKIRTYQDTIFTLNILTFSDDAIYHKVYDLVKTLIKDCGDKMILVENVPNSNTACISAIRNNGFRPYNNTNQYSKSYYKLPGRNIESHKLKPINPKDDLHVIDKHICLCDKPDLEAEAQARYTKQLLENNIANTNHESGCNCGCENCTCGLDLQTAEEFLGESICCKNKEEPWYTIKKNANDNYLITINKEGGSGGCLEIHE